MDQHKTLQKGSRINVTFKRHQNSEVQIVTTTATVRKIDGAALIVRRDDIEDDWTILSNELIQLSPIECYAARTSAGPQRKAEVGNQRP